MLVRITTSKFVAGLEIENGHVKRYAPILKFVSSLSLIEIQDLGKRLGWKVELFF